MYSSAATPSQYILALPDDRILPMTELRNILIQNLPKGFKEIISYGMISYVVPHALYPKGYHVLPDQPLPFISIASHKNYIALYHMGIYADQDILNWFKEEYSKHSKTKLDMGKSCIRFKNPDQIPLKLIGELASRMTPQQWIALYESQIKK
jgi:hypothetical protein